MFKVIVIMVACLSFSSVSLAETTKLTVKGNETAEKSVKKHQGKEIFEEAKVQAVITNSAQSKRSLPIAIVLLSKLKEIKDQNKAAEKAKNEKLNEKGPKEKHEAINP